MKNSITRFCTFSALIFTLAVALQLASMPAAHAASISKPKACHSLYVVLHGDQPAVVTCLDSYKGGISPNIYTDNCDHSNYVELFENSNRSGAHICFAGSGTADLSGYLIGPFYEWDNNTSSFEWKNSTFQLYDLTNCTGVHISYSSTGVDHRDSMPINGDGNWNDRVGCLHIN